MRTLDRLWDRLRTALSRLSDQGNHVTWDKVGERWWDWRFSRYPNTTWNEELPCYWIDE